MIQQKKSFKSLKVEFHILQSFPVTCLNRDDVGAPKTAIIGGSTRARVSSQCWKRQVRLTLHDLNIEIASRTKLIRSLIEKECLNQGASAELSAKCGSKVEQVFIKGGGNDKKKKKGNDDTDDTNDTSSDKSDTLLFFSPSEIKNLVQAFKENGFDPDKVITKKDAKKQAKEIADKIGKPNYAVDGLDIALFGRMVAQAPTMNVEAAASFAHAISTHKVSNEVDFFTALDDLQEDQGSAHMGSLEFNSATYYRYVSLDLGQLYESLAGQYLPEAVDAFVKALYLAVPSARQTTQSGACPWEFAKILVRRGQRLQVPFGTAVKAKNGGFLEPSKEALVKCLDRNEKLSGSLFGKIDSFIFGEDDSFSIDDLAESIKVAIAKAV